VDAKKVRDYQTLFEMLLCMEAWYKIKNVPRNQINSGSAKAAISVAMDKYVVTVNRQTGNGMNLVTVMTVTTVTRVMTTMTVTVAQAMKTRTLVMTVTIVNMMIRILLCVISSSVRESDVTTVMTVATAVTTVDAFQL
jgi:hypothetical protein